jgi:hypothetical protein
MAKNRRNRAFRRNGFSSADKKPMFDPLLRTTGVRGRQKRRFLNKMSSAIVFTAAFVTGLSAYFRFGVVGLIIGGSLGAFVAAHWAVRGRYFR